MNAQQRFTQRSKHAEQNRILKTARLRAEVELDSSGLDALPVGQVNQVYSLYSEVLHEGTMYLCVVRKTLHRVRDTGVVVGDRVRFRPTQQRDELGRPEGVIEQILPRVTVLTRADSFKALTQHPIVANAEQMLIVASLWQPFARWGLIDRMLVAARGGGLVPIVCLNKIDLADTDPRAAEQMDMAQTALSHYASLGIRSIQTSAERSIGIDALRDVLRGRVTVLAGHSGVGKSHLVRSIEPTLDIRVGEVSQIHLKGKHTTTSARRYPLGIGGAVIDTPGVKLFGLWNVTRETLPDFFPDVASGDAPDWRRESYVRIESSLPA